MPETELSSSTIDFRQLSQGEKPRAAILEALDSGARVDSKNCQRFVEALVKLTPMDVCDILDAAWERLDNAARSHVIRSCDDGREDEPAIAVCLGLASRLFAREPNAVIELIRRAAKKVRNSEPRTQRAITAIRNEWLGDLAHPRLEKFRLPSEMKDDEVRQLLAWLRGACRNALLNSTDEKKREKGATTAGKRTAAFQAWIDAELPRVTEPQAEALRAMRASCVIGGRVSSVEGNVSVKQVPAVTVPKPSTTAADDVAHADRDVRAIGAAFDSADSSTLMTPAALSDDAQRVPAADRNRQSDADAVGDKDLYHALRVVEGLFQQQKARFEVTLKRAAEEAAKARADLERADGRLAAEREAHARTRATLATLQERTESVEHALAQAREQSDSLASQLAAKEDVLTTRMAEIEAGARERQAMREEHARDVRREQQRERERTLNEIGQRTGRQVENCRAVRARGELSLESGQTIARLFDEMIERLQGAGVRYAQEQAK
jgi:hypothetical protein